VKQFGLIPCKTNLDVAQGFSPRQLRENHHAKHIDTTQGTHPGIAAVAFDDAAKSLPRNVLPHLRKKRLAGVHALPQVVQTCEHRQYSNRTESSARLKTMKSGQTLCLGRPLLAKIQIVDTSKSELICFPCHKLQQKQNDPD